jgi:putative heme iron utilization protein
MNTTFAAAAKALADNPDLRTQVMSVNSAAERADILRANGVPVPTHADVNDAHSVLAGVSGAGTATTAAEGTEVAVDAVTSTCAAAGAAAA